MGQLMDEPLKFCLALNGGEQNEIEYYYGRDNAGCLLRVNQERAEEMASGPPPPVLPEFKRCAIVSDFTGIVKRTTFKLYDYKEQ